MNNVTLVGRLTADPEVKVGNETQKAFCRFTVAVNRVGREGADFPTVIAFGKTAELIGQYVRRGSLVGITGKLQTSRYEKDGRPIFATDVIADRVEFLSKKGEEVAPPMESEKKQWLPKKDDAPPGFAHADDIPF